MVLQSYFFRTYVFHTFFHTFDLYIFHTFVQLYFFPNSGCEHYLNFNPSYLAAVKAPLQTLGLNEAYDILVNVYGGGLTGQADAIKQGAARALCELSIDNRKPLKIEGHLSRDPRAKERRKYGLKKARKAPQFSKR